MKKALRAILTTTRSAVEMRLFSEYGAIFVTTATPPPVIVFADSSQVEAFQSTLSIQYARIGDYEISLQAEAMDALVRAAAEMNDREGRIAARAADSGGRSYDDTVGLWLRNVTRGLERWTSEGRLSPERAQQARELTPARQIALILEMEDQEQIFFGTFFDRSILYSVAAPGASQHLSLLAFDVEAYQNEEVEKTLNRHGWFRTVPNDLPHFTYLGHAEESLPEMGLIRTEREYNQRRYGFWIPDLDSLR
ncbi:MAG TPA: hypothetical protein VJX74_06620 [Blastocatellia bacterium]|nr:hypothetical protein [Blastocatellia bacterium]